MVLVGFRVSGRMPTARLLYFIQRRNQCISISPIKKTDILRCNNVEIMVNHVVSCMYLVSD